MIDAINSFRQHLKQSHLVSRFLHGASWGLFGSIAAQGLTLASMIFVARLLGKETYGQFVLIQSTLTMFSTFAGFGIGAAVTHYVAVLKINDKLRLGSILALSERTIFLFGLGISLGIALLSPQLATNFLNSPSLATPFAIAAATVFFSTIDAYQKSVLVGFESMRAYAISTIAGVILGMPMLLIAANYYEIDYVAYALTMSTFIQAVISRAFVSCELRRNDIEKNIRGCLKEWRFLRDFALPALLAGVMVTPAHWICQIMLANSKNGFEEVAALAVAMQWFNAILILPNMASKVLIPILSQSVAEGRHSSSKKIIVVSIGANLMVTLPIAVVISAFASKILSAYGESFQDGSHSLIVAVFAAVLVATVSPVGNLLAAKSKMWTGLAMNLGWFLTYISISFFTKDYGAIGIVAALGVAYLLHLGWVVIWTVKNLPERS